MRGAGRVEIEEDEVGVLGDAQLKRPLGIRGAHDVAISGPSEDALDQLAAFAGAMDDQQAHVGELGHFDAFSTCGRWGRDAQGRARLTRGYRQPTNGA